MPRETFKAALAAGLAIAGLAAPRASAQSYPTERVSLDGFDIDGDMMSRELEPSADGRFIAFTTLATNFSDDEPKPRYDVFVRDRFERTLDLVSVGTAGEISDGDSRFPSISADGRFVAFDSTASTFDPDDLNAQRDIYLRDRETGETTLISRSLTGNAGNGSSAFASVSDDGRWIAFVSDAADLIEGDTNGEQDVFLYDGLFGSIRRVSVTASGGESGGGVVGQPAMTTDGMVVAFASRAADLVEGDPADFVDIFVYDRCTGAVELVSKGLSGGFPSGSSFSPSISADGRYVAFSSQAEDLVEDDANGFEDVFVYDRQTGETVIASVSSAEEPAVGNSFSPSISADGERLIFQSDAPNLTADDADGPTTDLFSRDLVLGRTFLQSLTWLDQETAEPVRAWRLADDGTWAGFASEDGALAPDDDNGVRDSYVRWVGDPCVEREPNDRFIDRTWFNLDAKPCSSISGKLEERTRETPNPDTYLLAFDKQDNVIAQDDNSSELGDGKASALWIEPVDHGDGSRSVRVAVTGRPDGVDGRPNGLLFNSPHGQLGGFRVFVSYVDEDGAPVLDECEDPVVDTAGGPGDVNGARMFLTGAELFRFNFFPPEGAAMAHVQIDNTVGEIPTCNDVDFMTFSGLPALCDVAITVVGCINYENRPEPVRLGWFDKDGDLLTDVASVFPPQPLTLSAVADVNGRVNIAVTGFFDDNFDGTRDFSLSRNVEQAFGEDPGHGACCCYTIIYDVIGHEPETPSEPGDELLMRNGDLNTDGVVNIADLSVLLSSWGATFP